MGMPEYNDGSFGPIKPVEESLKDLQENPEEMRRIKALHIGKFGDLVDRAAKRQPSEEPLAMILQSEWDRLRMDVNKIMIQLGIDDKNEMLWMKDLPKSL